MSENNDMGASADADRDAGLRPPPPAASSRSSIPSARKPRGAKGEAWGILNPYGDIWTHETFDSPEEARAYVAAFWRDIKSAFDVSRFKPIRVTVRVSATAAQAIEARSAETGTGSGNADAPNSQEGD